MIRAAATAARGYMAGEGAPRQQHDCERQHTAEGGQGVLAWALGMLPHCPSSLPA